MNLRIVRQQLQEIEDSLEQAVASADWEGVSALLVERQRYIENVFSEGIPETEKHTLRTMLEAVLEKDKQWVRAINAQKQQLHQKIQMLNQGRKSIQSYWNNE